jgi:hypothetical protein
MNKNYAVRGQNENKKKDKRKLGYLCVRAGVGDLTPDVFISLSSLPLPFALCALHCLALPCLGTSGSFAKKRKKNKSDAKKKRP